jgi:hypothetical protein
MNKYEKLFKKILVDTRSDNLAWKQERRGANSDVIFNSQLVFRQYSANFELTNQPFRLILIEKKFEDPANDYAFDKYVPELLVLQDSELVATLNESVIEGRDLLSLINLVETKSDRAKNLFDSL